MVYTGKPSKGCGMCKSRRIKCDEQRPICGQCLKSARKCPGYLDTFDLMFRDENKALAKKANKGRGRSESSDSGSSSNTALSKSTSPITTHALLPWTASNISSDQWPNLSLSYQPSLDFYSGNLHPSVPASITLSEESFAIAFFFRNFVTALQQNESTRGYLEILVPIYNNAASESALHLATNAVALATSGAHTRRLSTVQKAATAYGQALRKLKQDLQDDERARSDESVLATLLFTLYESVMGWNDTFTGWSKHVDGAVTLVKMRGPAQFDDPLSLSVFRAVRSVMVNSCVRRSTPISSFPGLEDWMNTSLSEENVANRLTLLCFKLPEIRARAQALYRTPYVSSLEAEAHALIELATTTDENLRQWYDTLPDRWRHRTIAVEVEQVLDPTTAARWTGEQHVYHDISISSLLNDYRICRIFCQRVYMACMVWLMPATSGYAASHNRATAVVQRLVDDLCACVPFHTTYELNAFAQERGQEKIAAESHGGYSIIWPLLVASSVDTIPAIQRAWLRSRLRMIGTKLGLQENQILALATRHVLDCGPMFP